MRRAHPHAAHTVRASAPRRRATRRQRATRTGGETESGRRTQADCGPVWTSECATVGTARLSYHVWDCWRGEPCAAAPRIAFFDN